MANIQTVTISCEILNDNKEEPGAFHVQLLRAGVLLYEREHWGLRENWDNGTSHETSSEDLSPRQLPAHGGYMLKVYVDSGEHIDVNANWSISILASDNTVIDSDRYAYIFDKSVREFETRFLL